MSVPRSFTCVFRRRIAAAASSPSPSSAANAARPFSSTCIRQRNSERKVRPVYERMPKNAQKDIDDVARTIPKFDQKGMEKFYTEEQLEALREAEKAIDPRDVITQSRIRTDHWAPQIEEDFTHIDPLLQRSEDGKNYLRQLKDVTGDDIIKQVISQMKDPRSTSELFELAEKEDLDDSVRSILAKLKAQAKDVEPDSKEEDYIRDVLHRYVPVPEEEVEVIEDSAKALLGGASPTAGPRTPVDPNDQSAVLKKVAQQIGYPFNELLKFRVKRLVFRRVVNMTRMGKIPSFYQLAIVGNGNGLIGLGEGKSAEVSDGAKQATLNAFMNIKPIVRYENRTIYGKIKKKVGGTTVEIASRPPGFGIRCMHLIFEVCRCAGIYDLSARVGRSRNPMNTVKATFEALTSQKLPEDIARARGRKLVDVRKVYYDGQVY